MLFTSITMFCNVERLISSLAEKLFGRAKEKDNEQKMMIQKKHRFLQLCGTSRHFWPDMDRRNAQLMLRDKPDGTFLVRMNTSDTDVALELVYKRECCVMFMRIGYSEETFSLDHSNDNLPKERSLDALFFTLMRKCRHLSLIVANEAKQNFGILKLKLPLLRDVSLMDHCKRKIVSSYPGINYRKLQIPRDVADFLEY